MSNPGFRASQAAQQASTQAGLNSARYAQQNVSRAMDSAATSRRMDSMHGYRRSPGQIGVLGLLGRLIGSVISLVVIAAAIGVFLVIVGKVDPDWFNHVKSWFDGLLSGAK